MIFYVFGLCYIYIYIDAYYIHYICVYICGCFARGKLYSAVLNLSTGCFAVYAKRIKDSSYDWCLRQIAAGKNCYLEMFRSRQEAFFPGQDRRSSHIDHGSPGGDADRSLECGRPGSLGSQGAQTVRHGALQRVLEEKLLGWPKGPASCYFSSRYLKSNISQVKHLPCNLWQVHLNKKMPNIPA